MSHTLGPWRWWTSNSRLRLSSDATRKDGDVLYAEKLKDGADVVVPNEDDRRLIAAAPLLLAALEHVRKEIGYEWLLPEFDIARESIAKATGEAA